MENHGAHPHSAYATRRGGWKKVCYYIQRRDQHTYAYAKGIRALGFSKINAQVLMNPWPKQTNVKLQKEIFSVVLSRCAAIYSNTLLSRCAAIYSNTLLSRCVAIL